MTLLPFIELFFKPLDLDGLGGFSVRGQASRGGGVKMDGETRPFAGGGGIEFLG